MIDEEVINYFEEYKKKYHKIMPSKFNKEISEYIKNRFPNENISWLESLYRIVNKLENAAKCVTCGKTVKFTERFNKGYPKHCSVKCANSDINIKSKKEKTNLEKYGCKCTLQNEKIKKKVEATNIQKYGTKFPMQSKEVKTKQKDSFIKIYGFEHPMQNEKVKNKQKQTNLERYGVDFIFCSKEIKAKAEQTNLRRYGCKCTLQNKNIRKKAEQTNLKRYGTIRPMQNLEVKEKRKQTNKEKYGNECVLSNKEVQQKIYLTKKKNNSFNNSKPEDTIYNLLTEKFGSENIKRQYKSRFYPFACDFYILSQDLYIELNFHWTHGCHPFNPLNESDQKKLNEWKQKNTTYYKHAIEIWTYKDPLKIKTAKECNLKILIFYTKKEFDEWFSKLSKN